MVITMRVCLCWLWIGSTYYDNSLFLWSVDFCCQEKEHALNKFKYCSNILVIFAFEFKILSIRILTQSYFLDILRNSVRIKIYLPFIPVDWRNIGVSDQKWVWKQWNNKDNGQLSHDIFRVLCVNVCMQAMISAVQPKINNNFHKSFARFDHLFLGAHIRTFLMIVMIFICINALKNSEPNFVYVFRTTIWNFQNKKGF